MTRVRHRRPAKWLRALALGVGVLASIGLQIGATVAFAEADAESLEGPRPTVTIPRVTRAPTLDDFLDMRPPADLAESLARIEGFVQRDPEDGKPASQRTHVYMGYDDRQLYFVFVAFDSEPDKMRAHVSRRENVFGDETVEVQLDTFHDQRRAFSFLTNPFGIQWDAIWTEGSGFDGSWDTVWQSRGEITDQGYVVWMSIPFKSLRFKPKERQTWGIVFVRDIPRNNEVSFWPRVSNRIDGRLNQEAQLNGLEGISPGRNIQLIPYVTALRARFLEDGAASFRRESFEPDGGIDAKFVLNDSLALDLTLNPDFNQVELDLPQVTVNQRFELFFPEKRPFFLENSGYFETPIDLLFTRRIGEPRAGARLTGKAGAYSLGGFVIDDDAAGKRVAPGTPGFGDRARFTILRASRDISEQSDVGVIYTERTFAGSHNRVGGVDGRFKLGSNWVSRFQTVYGSTDGIGDSAHNLVFNRNGRKFGAHIHYQDIGRDFRTESGFVPRTDIRDFHQSYNYTFRPEGKRLVSWRPSVFLQHISDHDGTRLDLAMNAEMSWQFRRQTSFSVFFNNGRERLRAGEFGLSAPLDFNTSSLGMGFSSRFVDAVSVNGNLSIGEGINFVSLNGPTAGDSLRGNVSVALRPMRKLLIDNLYLFSRLTETQGGAWVFTNEIVESRWSWQFDRRFSLRMILRHDRTRADPSRTFLGDSKGANTDLLLTYLVNPWTALFVGYNGNYVLPNPLVPPGTEDDYLNDSRQLFAKFSYLLRF